MGGLDCHNTHNTVVAKIVFRRSNHYVVCCNGDYQNLSAIDAARVERMLGCNFNVPIGTRILIQREPKQNPAKHTAVQATAQDPVSELVKFLPQYFYLSCLSSS